MLWSAVYLSRNVGKQMVCKICSCEDRKNVQRKWFMTNSPNPDSLTVN